MSKFTMALGKKAERIVTKFFEEAGFKVYPYGYEYTLPKLAKQRKKVVGRAADYIRHMPDLVIVNERNEAFFVEVKYRKHGQILADHIFNYPDCYVILLTSTHIMAQSTKYIHKNGYDFTYINKMPPFKDIPLPIIQKYVGKVRRALGDETFVSQAAEKMVEKVAKRKFRQPRARPKGRTVVGARPRRKVRRGRYK